MTGSGRKKVRSEKWRKTKSQNCSEREPRADNHPWERGWVEGCSGGRGERKDT